MKCIDTLQAKATVLKTELTAVWYAAKDKRIPLAPKIIIGIAIGYALSPIDLIPDFIPVLGYLDDLILLPALIALAIKLIPPEVMEDARKKAALAPLQLKKNWLFAGLFILIWILILAAIIAALIFE